MAAEELIKTSQIPWYILELLKKRGVVDPAQISRFLDPKLSDLPQPSAMHNLSKAAEIICQFALSKSQIVLWGDYDVDGTTATALLAHFFRELGVEITYHIPNRLTEGYGVNVAWFQQHQQSFSSREFLVITLDCGISNASEIDEIQAIGGTVIVTDHHALPKTELPRCIVVNPEQRQCGFHQHKLAGVGVAFYLAAAIKQALLNAKTLVKECKRLNLKAYLAFVAIGTVADLVPLTSVNRALVRGGLEALEQPAFASLNAFLAAHELGSSGVASEDIGYLLGPKLNAAGRLGDSRAVVDLFLSTDDGQITALIKKLDALNEKRKIYCLEDTEQAIDQAELLLSSKRPTALILAGDYHIGLAGIVASRITERYGKPSLVLGKTVNERGQVIYKGSGRSIDGLNLVASLVEAKDSLLRYGGHSMAVGVSLSEEDLSGFSVKLLEVIGEQLKGPRPKDPGFDLDLTVDQALERNTLRWLNYMEPFGTLNDLPRFRDREAIVLEARRVGKGGEHLSLVLRGKYQNHKGIAFGQGSRLDEIQKHPKRSIIFSPTRNRFRGTLSWQAGVLSM